MNYKPVFDKTLSLLAIVFFSPLMLLLLLLKLTLDGRPLFFVQERIGKHKMPFKLIKIRTMRGSEVTAYGQILRATGLDELPQLIQVLKGDMSLVGPRPLTRDDINRLGWNGLNTKFRWSVLPGLTGSAQLHSGKGAMASLLHDAEYIQKHTPWIDCKYLMLSLLVNIIGKNRTRKYFL